MFYANFECPNGFECNFKATSLEDAISRFINIYNTKFQANLQNVNDVLNLNIVITFSKHSLL